MPLSSGRSTCSPLIRSRGPCFSSIQSYLCNNYCLCPWEIYKLSTFSLPDPHELAQALRLTTNNIKALELAKGDTEIARLSYSSNLPRRDFKEIVEQREAALNEAIGASPTAFAFEFIAPAPGSTQSVRRLCL